MYGGAGDEEVVPEWVQNEKEQFQNFRDKDKDGFMSADEVRDWIMPVDYDHSKSEARHLVYEADKNKVRSTCTLLQLRGRRGFCTYWTSSALSIDNAN